MNIGCTKKLLDELKCKSTEAFAENPIFSWHANLLTMNRRKAVLLINDDSRYPVLLFGLKAADFKMLDKLITLAIEETFLAEGFSTEIVEKYLSAAGPLTFNKTSNKSIISTMNQIAGVAKDYENEELNFDQLNQTDFNLRMGQWLYKSEDGYKHPRDVLVEAMTKLDQREANGETVPIITIKAYQFLITLQLEKYKVWRRVQVPADITFKKLHDVIQAAFRWRNYHLHEFTVFNQEKPIALIVCNEEALYENEDIGYPIGMDKRTKLSQHLPQFNKIEYVYDFGDHWVHSLELEKTIDDYPVNYPICVDGEGNCPPEDVGGEAGYENFLEVISDPDHPEHQDMLTWGKMQEYREFNLEDVNFQLKFALKRR